MIWFLFLIGFALMLLGMSGLIAFAEKIAKKVEGA